MNQSSSEITPDVGALAEQLEKWIRTTIQGILKKRGVVIGISGGIDSTVTAALLCRAIGPKHVLGIAMPEKDSSPESLDLARKLAAQLGMELLVEDLTAGLEGQGAYRRRDEAVCRVFPHYKPGDAFKITLQSNPVNDNIMNTFQITLENESGEEESVRLSYPDYAQIVAASNMKQRMRMSTLYYHGELRNYAVVGTGNKNEVQLGFFVKYGDGGSDFIPLGNLYKTQVYELARYLKVPEEIINRRPTTDTYPAEQTQEDFFFRLPFATLDAIWHGMENGESENRLAARLNLDPLQIKRVWDDLQQKHRSTRYLRTPPIEFYPETPAGTESNNGSSASSVEIKNAAVTPSLA
jgi:NAD+ synthase